MLLDVVFNENRPKKNVDDSFVTNIVKKYIEMRSVQNRKHQREQSVAIEANEIGNLGMVTGISKYINRIHKKFKFWWVEI